MNTLRKMNGTIIVKEKKYNMDSQASPQSLSSQYGGATWRGGEGQWKLVSK